jgi:hypothetical protein
MLYHGDVAENQGNNNVGGAGLEALYEPGCDAWRIGEVTEAGGVEFV